MRQEILDNADILEPDIRDIDTDIKDIDIDKEDSTRISSAEKDELMDFAKKQEGLGLFYLFMAGCVIFLILSVFIPKIYLSNNIYYVSRDIARLHGEKELLHEERIRLQREIERINERHLWLELGE